jgi:hypothetical protein
VEIQKNRPTKISILLKISIFARRLLSSDLERGPKCDEKEEKVLANLPPETAHKESFLVVNELKFKK